MTQISLIGDSHIGNRHFREKEFKNALRTSEKIIIMGDLIEGISKKDKRHSNKDTILTVDQQVIKAIDILKPYRKKILYYLMGNHESTVISVTDNDPQNTICEVLGIPAGITEHVKMEKTMLWVSHGTGSPLTYSGCVMQLEKFAKDYIGDINAIGHTHKLFDLTEYRHPKQKFQLVNTGTFLDGAEYAQKMKLPPAAIGYYIVDMKTKTVTKKEYK